MHFLEKAGPQHVRGEAQPFRNFETAGDVLTGKLLHKVETDSDKNSTPDQPPPDTAEFFGPFTLVNGSLWPTVPVRCRPYRLRVLNGSNARSYQLFLVDDTNKVRNDLIRQIGTDAGLLGQAVPIDSLTYPPRPDSPGAPPLAKGLILSPGWPSCSLTKSPSHSNRRPQSEVAARLNAKWAVPFWLPPLSPMSTTCSKPRVRKQAQMSVRSRW